MKKRIIIIGSIIAVLAIGAVIVFYPKKSAVLAFIKVTRGSISETVNVTGTTTPATSVELSFETTGRVTHVYANVADTVKAGDPLVEVDKSTVLAQLAEAKAGLDSAQAHLAELVKGTRPEQIAITKASVANAQVTADNARTSLMDSINSAYTASDDAGRNKTDSMFLNPRTQNPQFIATTTNSQSVSDLNSEKAQVEKHLTAWKANIDALNDQSDLLAASDAAKTSLNEIANYLDDLSLALNSASANGIVTQAMIDEWKANDSTARANINTAIGGLQASTSAMRSATAELSVEQNNLDLEEAGSTPEDIDAQKAAVAQAAANVQSVQVQLDKTVLRSPIDGIVTRQDAKLGQIVTVSTSGVSNSGLVSIISPYDLEVEADIPETEIGKVAAGQDVALTFDALPGENFDGKVKKIDPAETIIDGVVNYKVTVDFADQKKMDGIKSGLTANLNIKTAVKSDVLLLPQYAILENDQGTFVRVSDGKGGTKDVTVKLGARDQNGMVEIVSGVTEGEEVVNIGLIPS